MTGRRHPSARRVAEDLGGEVPLVLHNGALVVEDGRVLRCRPLPRARGPARHPRRARGGRGARPALRRATARAGCSWTRRRAPAASWATTSSARGARCGSCRTSLAALDAEEPIQVMFGGTRAEMEALSARSRRGARGRGAHRAHRLPRDRRRAPRRARPRGGQGGGARLPAGALGHRRLGDARDRRQLERPRDGRARPASAS